MNKNLMNMLTISHELQQAGKEPRLTVLPSTAKRSRKMMLRGNKTAS